MMKKYLKRIIAFVAILLAFVLILPIAACGEENVGPSDTDNPGGTGDDHTYDEYWVERIEVEKGEGFRENYADGDTFDRTGLTVTAYWNDGYVEVVDSVKYAVVPSIITEGVTEVTIIYGDASLTIPISSVLITGLDIVKMPSNTTYFVGEVFKADGMVLRYTLDNGEYREISDFSAADVTFDQTPLELGDDSITITYNGYTCEVPITVMGRGFKIEAKKEGENITITDPENAAKPSKEGTNETIKEFASNGDFMQDFSEGCVMTFTFESDTPQVNLLLQASSTYVTEYSEIVTWAPITVEDMQVNRIFDMTVNGRKVPINDTAVLYGDETDKKDGDVACLANWTEVDLGIVNVNTDQVNTVSLTFKDNGYRNANDIGMPAPYIDYFMISNIEDDNIVTDIEITSGPTKTEYVQGQSFDRTGMVVTATHKDGSKTPVESYSVTPSVLTESGDSVELTVSYAEFEQKITVKVIDKVSTGIEVTTPPNKLTYLAGESFDPTGMVVSEIYNDGSETPISGYTWSPNGALGSDDEKITVSYTNASEATYTAEIAISVKEMTGIEITTAPDRTEYANGQPFDPAGMVVSAVYNDGSKTAVSGYVWSPEGGLPIGTTEVTISYNGFTAKQSVTVTGEEVLSHISVSGVPETVLSVGDELPSVSANDLTVTAHYFSGKTETLSSDAYDLTVPTGKAAIGSAVVATLKSDPSFKAVVPFNVSTEINIEDGMVTGNKNYRTNVAWAPGAKNGDFVQNCMIDSVITFTFDSATESYAELTLTGASGWVQVYENLPKTLGDMYAAAMFDLEVNGVMVTVNPDAKLAGGEYETASNNNLAVWSDAVLAKVKLNAGSNTVKLIFKDYSYLNGNADHSKASPNLDYLTVTSVE